MRFPCHTFLNLQSGKEQKLQFKENLFGFEIQLCFSGFDPIQDHCCEISLPYILKLKIRKRIKITIESKLTWVRNKSVYSRFWPSIIYIVLKLKIRKRALTWMYSRCWPSTRSTGRSSTWTDSLQGHLTSPPTIIICLFEPDYFDQEKTRAPIRITKASYDNHMPLWHGLFRSKAPTRPSRITPCLLPR